MGSRARQYSTRNVVSSLCSQEACQKARNEDWKLIVFPRKPTLSREKPSRPVFQAPFAPVVHPKLILSAAVCLAWCGSIPPVAGARPSPGAAMWQSRRRRTGQSASPSGRCCGRGRPHSGRNHLGRTAGMDFRGRRKCPPCCGRDHPHSAVNVSGPQRERRPPAWRVAHRAVPEVGAPQHGFALTTAPPCDTLRACRNLHWDAVSARCWAAIRF